MRMLMKSEVRIDVLPGGAALSQGVHRRAVRPDLPARVGRSVVAVVCGLMIAGCGGGGGDGGDLAEPEVKRPPNGDPSSIVTTTIVADTAVAAASGPTTTAAPLPDVDDFDLAATSVDLLCPGREANVELSGNPTESMAAAVVQDLSHDLDLDGIPERVVVASCRLVGGPVDPEGDVGAVQRPEVEGHLSVVALTAGPEGLAQVGPPFPAGVVHEVDESLVAEGAWAVDGTLLTTYTPLTVLDGRLAEGGTGFALSTADPAMPMGLGGLEVGASFAILASNVGGAVTIVESGFGPECVVAHVPGGPEGIRGLGGDGTLASVEITNPDVRTDTGLGVGSSEDEVWFTYADHVAPAHDPADPSRAFLVAAPPDTDGLTAVFDVADGRVISYRIGEPGWTSALDGCG